MNVAVAVGAPERLRPAIAALYRDAFAAKLRPVVDAAPVSEAPLRAAEFGAPAGAPAGFRTPAGWAQP